MQLLKNKTVKYLQNTCLKLEDLELCVDLVAIKKKVFVKEMHQSVKERRP